MYSTVSGTLDLTVIFGTFPLGIFTRYKRNVFRLKYKQINNDQLST